MLITSEKIKYDVELYQSRTLICTSSLTAIPIVIAYKRGLYFHAITSVGNFAFSVLYWYKPVHGWRRNLDLLYEKYAFCVYLISGVFFMPPGLCAFIFYVGTIALAHCYLSTMKYPKKWLQYHILFHLISIATKTHIITNFIMPIGA